MKPNNEEVEDLTDEIMNMHKELLYPSVRVRTEKAGGSGTIIYCKPKPDNKDEYETYILTNHHVIEDAISIKKKWSSIANRNIDKEVRSTVFVETFEYKYGSTIIGARQYEADIVAWDKDQDIALLKLRTIGQFKYIAKMYPKDKQDDVKLFEKTVAVGCSLGHPPIPTFGIITSKHDEIENEDYWMSTSQIIFGNSGGSMYLERTHELIGIPARIESMQLGFSINVVTHMGFFVPIDRIYKFLEDQIFQFVFDPKFTSDKCEKMRQKRAEEEEKKLLLPETEQETKA